MNPSWEIPMTVAMAESPNPRYKRKTMTTASATVKIVVNFRAMSMRWAPMTMASKAAPTLEIIIITANMDIAPEAEVRNCGGTPANWANLREKIAEGISPAM